MCGILDTRPGGAVGFPSRVKFSREKRKTESVCNGPILLELEFFRMVDSGGLNNKHLIKKKNEANKQTRDTEVFCPKTVRLTCCYETLGRYVGAKMINDSCTRITSICDPWHGKKSDVRYDATWWDHHIILMMIRGR